MTSCVLRTAIDEYLVLRRGLGFDLKYHARLLEQFAAFADRVGHRGPITTDLAVRWAKSFGMTDSANVARRLRVLRGFARHQSAFDPGTEIPAPDLFACRYQRKPPHIYSDTEISALLRTAATIRPENGLRPQTYVAVFSLLASSGLRISEVCKLQREDVDLKTGILTIRVSKFRKSRLVPLHPSAIEPLRCYALRRDRGHVRPRSKFFFCTDWSPRLTTLAVEMAFIKLRRRLKWHAENGLRAPHIHDLRHTFAVRCLLRWYHEGADLDHKIATLATYLGHAKVSDTSWYLSAVPELMTLTAQRFERFAQRPEAIL